MKYRIRVDGSEITTEYEAPQTAVKAAKFIIKHDKTAYKAEVFAYTESGKLLHAAPVKIVYNVQRLVSKVLEMGVAPNSEARIAIQSMREGQ